MRLGWSCAAALAAAANACAIPIGIPTPPPPPTAGYGEPYHGTGQPIYVKDSRNDWAIAEGGKPISSEQALEATGDPEYEARRQIAKDYNVKLYREAAAHKRNGYIVELIGLLVIGAGIYALAVLPGQTKTSTDMPATTGMPEMRTTKPGPNTTLEYYGGYGLAITGLLIMFYGNRRGRETPPYEAWHTPTALNRPAYVRQMTEPYNEKHGAPTLAEQPGSVEPVLAPGQRKPPPPRPRSGKPK